MKVAVIGSRESGSANLELIASNLPDETDEIVSGGAPGIDALAQLVAKQLRLKFVCFLPDYAIYGKGAPMVRNQKIVAYSDLVLAFWNNRSSGTKFMIRQCLQENKPLKIINI